MLCDNPIWIKYVWEFVQTAQTYIVVPKNTKPKRTMLHSSMVRPISGLIAVGLLRLFELFISCRMTNN